MTKNIKTYIWIVGAAAAIIGVIWIARPAPNSQTNNTGSAGQNSGGVLSAEETSFDFGEVSMAAGNVSHIFKVKNTGTESVTIDKMYTSCMCTTASLMMGDRRLGPYGMLGHGFIPKINQKIEPGEEAVIEVVFDPAAHGPAGVGRIERLVLIENSAGQPLELGLTAFVTP